MVIAWYVLGILNLLIGVSAMTMVMNWALSSPRDSWRRVITGPITLVGVIIELFVLLRIFQTAGMILAVPSLN